MVDLLRVGGGTRIELSRRLRTAVPVVTAAIGAEGLGVVGGTHLELADDAEDLARKCILILRNPSVARRFTLRAHALYSQRLHPRRDM
jgi:hypothetical protein